MWSDDPEGRKPKRPADPRRAWASDDTFAADWDNELDADYDRWEEPYGGCERRLGPSPVSP